MLLESHDLALAQGGLLRALGSRRSCQRLLDDSTNERREFLFKKLDARLIFLLYHIVVLAGGLYRPSNLDPFLVFGANMLNLDPFLAAGLAFGHGGLFDNR